MTPNPLCPCEYCTNPCNYTTPQPQENIMMTTDAELQSNQQQLKELTMLDTLNTLVNQIADRVLDTVVDKIKDAVIESLKEEFGDHMQSLAEDVAAEAIGNTRLTDFYDYEDTIEEVVKNTISGCNWQLVEA